MLDAIKADGTMAALDMGTVDQWESATMGFQNIGPNYWKVKKGVRACSPAPRSSPIRSTSPSGTSLPAGPLPARRLRGTDLPGLAELFTLGQAAIFPAGSWEISPLTSRLTSPWGHSRRPCPKAPTPATSATTPISPWA